ncbi:MAG TPA: response regulator [Blastocatellia bacterium]|nr:response regulator [Blastocatellia bacterium]
MNPHHQPRILCVDDDTDSRELVVALVGLAGLQVILAESAAEALRLARQGDFALFILDTVLADGSGVELCKAIRGFDSNTPILFYSAAAYPTDIDAAMQAGANAYLTKPGGFDELSDTVNRLVTGDATTKPQKLPRTRSARGNRVCQIAYDESLLFARAELLKNRGYEVKSILGNEEAKRLLGKDQDDYRVFIVGHAASIAMRQEMIQWLRANFPAAKILALNPLSDPAHTGADYDFILNGPEEWLARVANIVA